MSKLECALCGTPEDQRPLLPARFDGREVHFCPGCIPSLIHGMPAEQMAQHLRDNAVKA
jgi:hypothetical protein